MKKRVKASCSLQIGLASRVMNTDRHLAGSDTASVSGAFTADYWEDLLPDM